MKSLHVDVLIVGAGLSGVGAASRLVQERPDATFAVLESREAMGGTWDLFRYPGIRSDSDMVTFSYPFRPWTRDETLTDGATIREYIADTAREQGIEDRIRYGQRVISASWSSATARWSVRAETDEGLLEHTARFLYVCTGYYSYESGHVVDFPGQETFGGTVIHPQFWPQDFDPTGKRIVVIGSGATAITLIPALAEQGAEHVTMLQRSPTYVLPVPGRDDIGRAVRRVLPERAAYRTVRAWNVVRNVALYEGSRRFPGAVRKGIAALNARGVGRAMVREHFTPRYDPWDQRLCVVPDGDLFRTLRRGDRASVVTDTIETFTPRGIRTSSGRELEADAIVTATGLRIELAGGITFLVDGEPVVPGERFLYKGAMLDGVPNLALCIGYTNNSWTLRADLTSRFVCALLGELRRRGADAVTPRADPGMEEGEMPFSLTSGYVQRAKDLLPKQGLRAPWQARHNYLVDRRLMSVRRLGDPGLEYSVVRRGGDEVVSTSDAPGEEQAQDPGVIEAAAALSAAVAASAAVVAGAELADGPDAETAPS